MIFINGAYYPNPTFPNAQNPEERQQTPADIYTEQSYIENILRMNKGKKVRLYATFPDAQEWRDRVFSGILEQAGKDHILINDRENDKWYLLPMVYLNFVEADERLNYNL